ncbi:MAG: hypothetical protein QOF07_2701, partial [Bradyrhizobium sp.]|nr:hypothetical protein [Bradyrhizobium sp.]
MPRRWPSRNAAGLAGFVSVTMIAVALFLRAHGANGHELMLGFPTAIVAGTLLLRPRWWPFCLVLAASFEPLAGLDRGQALVGELAEVGWVVIVAVVARILSDRSWFTPTLARVRDLLWFSSFALIVPLFTAGIHAA